MDLRDNEHCEIIGIEIDDSAVPVQTQPFKGNTAFMLGNEGQGLTDRQVRTKSQL
jgi:tRNA G18 (ribose-2'-O)-methylase SpoU